MKLCEVPGSQGGGLFYNQVGIYYIGLNIFILRNDLRLNTSQYPSLTYLNSFPVHTKMTLPSSEYSGTATSACLHPHRSPRSVFCIFLLSRLSPSSSCSARGAAASNKGFSATLSCVIAYRAAKGALSPWKAIVVSWWLPAACL